MRLHHRLQTVTQRSFWHLTVAFNRMLTRVSHPKANQRQTFKKLQRNDAVVIVTGQYGLSVSS